MVLIKVLDALLMQCLTDVWLGGVRARERSRGKHCCDAVDGSLLESRRLSNLIVLDLCRSELELVYKLAFDVEGNG